MTAGDLKRWLYRSRRPNWIARAVNRVWATLATAGVAPLQIATLEVVGRMSGRMTSLPVVPALVDGQRYLVSMLGDGVQWVRNVRAAGGRAALCSGTREEIRLVEVAVEERAPILKAYLHQAPGGRPHVPIDKDAPLADFAAIAREFPVFRVVSAEEARG